MQWAGVIQGPTLPPSPALSSPDTEGSSTHRMLVVVHALGQNGAEGDGGQGPRLLAHRPDLQKSPERCGGGMGSGGGSGTLRPC